jgi:hypothetical protein
LRNLIIVSLVVAAMAIPASAITGLGFGIHAGQTVGYSYDLLDNQLGQIADSLGLMEDLTFNEELTTIGAHVKVATLPIIDFFVFGDYSWKKKNLTQGLDFRISDFAVGVSAKKIFGAALLKPFVGVGGELHHLAYSLEADDSYSGSLPADVLPIPDNQSKMGFHVLAGAELNFPIFPIDPYAQYKYTWITTEDKTTKYGLIEVGLTFSL